MKLAALIALATFMIGCTSKPPEIKLEIHHDGTVYLEDELTPIDSIGSRINNIVDNYNDVEKDSFRVRLIVDETVKMGYIMDIKTQLRRVNALRLIYTKAK